ncbi:MAG: 50S ribosomal protein L29 [Paraprevotella sp.]|jgi:ribosomal protein L29|nr:50S ribosomal protein L29 [Paraprevotella sp.]MBP3471945.1 50S ribosomal protein L29 [Paraprevotella sp.]
MKNAEIIELADNELVEKIQTEEANYAQMLLNHSISPLENPNQIKAARRTIARLKTELRKRELNVK